MLPWAAPGGEREVFGKGGSMSATMVAPGQRFRLSLVSWEKYEQMVAWFEGRHVRLTYDRGELELMTTSREHERGKHLLGGMLLMLVAELNIDIDSAGSMTFKREN